MHAYPTVNTERFVKNTPKKEKTLRLLREP